MCRQSRKRDHCLAMKDEAPVCVCVCVTLVTCSTSSTFDMKVFSDFTSLTVPFSHNMQEFSASVADFPFSVVKLSRRYQR